MGRSRARVGRIIRGRFGAGPRAQHMRIGFSDWLIEQYQFCEIWILSKTTFLSSLKCCTSQTSGSIRIERDRVWILQSRIRSNVFASQT